MADIEIPWAEQDVRRLLNTLRRPDVALSDPLGRLLCGLTQSRTPHEAVRKLIERAFLNRGHMGGRLARLVVRCDLDGMLSHEGVAAELGLSPRQFYRYRTRAIGMLSAEIHRMIAGAGEAEDLDGLIAALECTIAQLKSRRLAKAG